MTERECLLRAVLENPLNDVPRMVYADWLEENGEPDRAEFVRLQIELAQITYKDQICRKCKVRCDDNKSKYCEYGSDPDGKNGHNWENLRRDILRKRESDLRHGKEMRLVSDGFASLFGLSGIFGTDHGFEGGVGGLRWKWQRGFIFSISLSCRDFMEHAKAIFSAEPVMEVRLVDRVAAIRSGHSVNGEIPLPPPYGWAWQQNNRATAYWVGEGQTAIELIDEELYKLLKGGDSRIPWPHIRAYPTEQEANQALSDACVCYGRKLAGLPPLEKVPCPKT